ncbi:hypothetical protein L7F22_024311, partial [Adiantum nelumboides]|nr:hypothetical protein [Adiantum nelumboides]
MCALEKALTCRLSSQLYAPSYGFIYHRRDVDEINQSMYVISFHVELCSSKSRGLKIASLADSRQSFEPSSYA